MKTLFYILAALFLFVACRKTNHKLPILGDPVVSGQDTVFPTVQPFSFVNQDSVVITERTFENRIYVADFIFLSCPTICPVMTMKMRRVYERYGANPHVFFLSHTIDPEHDSIPKLKEYSERLRVDSRKWFFVTGNKDSLYTLADNSYFTIAYPDQSAPGGYTHSGALLLIDKDRHIRGVYDGTNEDETERLLEDIETLLKEQY